VLSPKFPVLLQTDGRSGLSFEGLLWQSKGAPKMRRSLLAFLAVAALALATGNQALAQGPVVTFSIDELGHGTVVSPVGTFNDPGVIRNDPGPGGLASALTYSLLNPPSVVAGDWLILEPGGGLSDLIRFNAAGTGGDPGYPASIVFYSDAADGSTYPVTSGIPTRIYSNVIAIPEVSLGNGTDGVVYTPTAGQPGFVAGFTVTYTIVSTVPEPGSLVLGGLVSVIGLALVRFRRRRLAV
jgi:hypothetical protein